MIKLDWIDISGQIIAAVIAGVLLLIISFIYKRYSEKISKNWYYLFLFFMFTWLLFQVYIFSMGNFGITITAFSFVFTMIGFIVTLYFNALSHVRVQDYILEEKLNKSYKALEKALNERVDAEIASLKLEVLEIELKQLLKDATEYNENKIYTSAIESCSKILQSARPNSYLFSSAVDIVKEALGNMININEKWSTYRISELKIGLDRAPKDGKLEVAVKTITNLLEKL